MLDEQRLAAIDAEAMARVDAAVAFADASPFPAADSLYDDVYVLDDAIARAGTRSRRPSERSAGGGADDGDGSANDEIPQQLTSALAAGEDGGDEPCRASDGD